MEEMIPFFGLSAENGVRITSYLKKLLFYYKTIFYFKR